MHSKNNENIFKNHKVWEKSGLTVCQNYICNVWSVSIVNKHNRRNLDKTNDVI